MGYLDVKQEIQTLEDEVVTLNSDIKECESTLLSKKKELSKLDEEKKNTISKEKIKALEDFEKDICKPFKEKDDEYQKTKKKIKEKRDSLLHENSSDRMKAKVKAKMNLNDNEALVKNIREKTSEIYGEETLNKLKDLVYKSEISNSMEAQDNLLTQLDRISAIESKKPNVLSGLLETLNKVEFSKDSPEKAFIPLAAIVVIVLVGFKFYAVLILSLLLFIAYSFYKSFITLRSLSYSETFASSKKELDELIDKRVDDCVKDRAKKIENDYSKASKQLEALIVKNEHAQEIELLKQKQMFSFNPTDIEKEYALRSENLKQSLDMTEQTLKDKTKKLNEQGELIKSKKNELLKLLRDLGKEFLPPKPINNENVPRSFLFDIVNDEPIVKDVPYSGCLFLYEDEEVCSNFIKSLFYQINYRVHPSLVKNYYCDELNMGEDLITCNDLENFSLCTDQKKWESQLTGFKELIRKRVNLMREQGNIDSYNDFMRSQDCLPENKILIFHRVKSDSPSLDSDDLVDIMRNSSKYGLSYFIFLNLKEFLKSPNDNLLRLIDVIPCTYFVSDTSIKKRSKEYLKMLISKTKNNS